MTGWLLLQRARASRPVFDLFVHRLLRAAFPFFRWELVVLRDGLPHSTLDDSFCFPAASQSSLFLLSL